MLGIAIIDVLTSYLLRDAQGVACHREVSTDACLPCICGNLTTLQGVAQCAVDRCEADEDGDEACRHANARESFARLFRPWSAQDGARCSVVRSCTSVFHIIA